MRINANLELDRILHKVDFFIVTYECLAYFTKWLDQANLSNAYVSGMREDLSMLGTEYNLAVTCFQVGKPVQYTRYPVIREVGTNSLSAIPRPDPRPRPSESLTCVDPTADAPPWSRALMGSPNTRYKLRRQHASAISHPLPHRVSGGKLLCRCLVSSRILVQEDRNQQAHSHL